MLQRKRSERAFTLIEIMVVCAIIALLAAIVVPRIMHRMDEARASTAAVQIRELETAIDFFKMDNGFYPASLEDLVRRPAAVKKWPPEGYLKEIPKDPWGNDYVYIYPGTHGAYDLVSYGADAREGGENENADITNYPK